MDQTFNYRMTQEEFERFVSQHDPMSPGSHVPAKLARANPSTRIKLGYGAVTYDAGFYWVRTRLVKWM